MYTRRSYLWMFATSTERVYGKTIKLRCQTGASESCFCFNRADDAFFRKCHKGSDFILVWSFGVAFPRSGTVLEVIPSIIASRSPPRSHPRWYPRNVNICEMSRVTVTKRSFYTPLEIVPGSTRSHTQSVVRNFAA